MARLVPEIPKKCTRSERRLYERMGRELPDDWILLHSLELTRHPQKMWGETDIVVVSTKGVFVIEVKGGTISSKKGVWTVTSLNGKDSYHRNESPWGQANTAASSLRSTIYADKRFRGCLIGSGVALPYERFTHTGAEIIQDVLWDKRHRKESLQIFIGRVAAYWERRYEETNERPSRKLSRDDIVEIRKLLRPDVHSHFSLGSYLNALEAELIELTAQQAKILKGMAANRKSVVTGLAGTGKTILAVERAKQYAAKGNRVLYVCFNKLLASHIAGNIPEDLSGHIEVTHLHSYYRKVIEKAGKLGLLHEQNEDTLEFYGSVMPEAFIESALTIDLTPFDVVIVDEAQDILTPAHLDAIDILVTDGLALGSWHFFLDPKQDIYGKVSEIAHERIEQIGFASFELTSNCRNTKPVAVETSVVAGFDCAIEGAIDGPACKAIIYSDANDFERKLIHEVEQLSSQEVGPLDLILLSTRKKKGSLVRNLSSIAGYPIVDLTETVPSANHIAFCTMHAFKGLERKCVLAIDIQDLDEEGSALLHYAGLSRAQTFLVTFMGTDRKAQYDKHLRSFGARLVAE